ncbi:MAG: DUF3048 domain-containing protein [Candidatus Dormibacteria bacterium]
MHFTKAPIATAVLGLLALVALLSACAPGDLSVFLNVPDGAQGVEPATALTLRFNTPVDPAAFSRQVRLTPATAGHWVPSGVTAFRFEPESGALDDTTVYELALGPVPDSSHGSTASGHWSFTTGTALRVAEATVGAQVVHNGGRYSRAAQLEIQFSQAVDPGSVVVSLDGGAPRAVTVLAPIPDPPEERATHAGAPGAVSAGSPPLVYAPDLNALRLSLAGTSLGTHRLDVLSARTDSGESLAAPYRLTFDTTTLPQVSLTPLPYPLLVQIEDSPDARPQTGLQEADMVFDYTVEGGITRYTAIYSQLPATVGPIRSARFISLPLQRMYGGLLACSGVSPATLNRIDETGTPTLFDSGYFHRVSTRYAPHNLYADAPDLLRAEVDRALPARTLSLFTAHPSPWRGGDGTAVTATEHRDAWTYDPTLAGYTLTRSGVPAVDGDTIFPLVATTVIMLHARSWVTDQVEDVAGAFAIDYDLSSGGSAELYNSGVEVDGRWSRPAADRPLVFSDLGGRGVPLPAGLTWVEVVP